MNKIFFMRYLNPLQKAFEYWIKTFHIQILASLLFFGLLSIFSVKIVEILNLNHLPAFITAEAGKPTQEKEVLEFIKNPNFAYLIFSLIFIFSGLFPLSIGLFNIYEKISQKEKFKISDLFIGYIGNNFFKYTLSFLFWYFVLSFLSVLHPLISVLWIFFCIFSVPIMFFLNVGIFQAIKLSFISVKNNIGIAFISTITILLFYVFFLSLIPFSLLFISFFWTSIIYAFYKEIFIVTEK